MRPVFSILLLAVLLPGSALCFEPEIVPVSARSGELSAVKDRLATSLSLRGELADRIMDAGLAGELVALDGLETNAEVRSALLGWINKNAEQAAGLYLRLRGGGAPAAALESYKTTYELNPVFLSLIKDLNAAAGGRAVSDEALELAARRLYEGPQAGPGGAVVTAGGGPKGNSFFSVDYADRRLNRAGLERELSAAGAWLGAARGASGRGPAGLEKEYGAALADYGSFIAAAAAVKGRGVITPGEARGLEAGRAALRVNMAVLALRSRAADLAAISALLASYGPAPGGPELQADISGMRNRLEEAAGRARSGATPLSGLGRLTRAAEAEFSALYLRYSAYNGLLALKKRVAASGFSCFYDYAIYRYLAAFFPASPYPSARAELMAARPALDAALAAAGAGNVPAALLGLGERVASVKEAQRFVSRASSFNRGAQFFLWGLLFRPVEYRVSADGGRPVFTFTEIMRSRR
ncbi:MAG TPA: hypothetical protein DCS63_11110 [Elusimicrobia bacterium]|nr:hypothetical protein [Elusimicrobiota bacterium]